MGVDAGDEEEFLFPSGTPPVRRSLLLVLLLLFWLERC